jgi:molybdopterin/thiamine biosynthesis adenylyltransferase
MNGFTMTQIILRISAHLWQNVKDWLVQGQQDHTERMCFLLASRAISKCQGEIYLADHVILPGREDMEIQSAGLLRPNRKFQALAYYLAAEAKMAIIDLHTHTHPGQPHFSAIDDKYGLENAIYVAKRFPASCRMGMIVLGEDLSAFEGKVYNPDKLCFEQCDRIEILGSPISMMPDVTEMKESEMSMFARHCLIPGWNQARMANIRVGQVGAGGTGALILQGLAGMGVGRRAGIVLADPDFLEKSNLPRLPYATRRDVGRRKSKVAARYFRQRDRGVRIEPYALRVQDYWAKEALKTAHVLVGCVDSEGARKVLMEISLRYLIPYVDVATEILPVADGKYDSIGQVRVVIPGLTGCLFCCNGIDLNEAALDLMPARARRRRQRMGYVRNTQETPTAAVIHLNGILTHFALSHLAKLISGEDLTGHEHLYYSRNRDSLMAVGCKPNPNCPACGPGGILGAGDPLPKEATAGSMIVAPTGSTPVPEAEGTGEVQGAEMAVAPHCERSMEATDGSRRRTGIWSWLFRPGRMLVRLGGLDRSDYGPGTRSGKQ